VTAEVRRHCASVAEAERLRAAVVADDPEFVDVRVDGSDLVARVVTPSAGSARTTLDDLLACLAAAEKTTAI
jgi:hypothetical protein